MGIVETGKELVEIARKIDNIELYKQILALQTELLKLAEDNSALKERTHQLEQTLATKTVLKFKDNAYWLPAQENNEDGPYCTFCWDKDGKLVHQHFSDTSKIWFCIIHNLFGGVGWNSWA